MLLRRATEPEKLIKCVSEPFNRHCPNRSPASPPSWQEDRKKMDDDFVAEIEKLIADRTTAKKEKNFALADEIRAKLLDMGIVIEDTREGVKWKKA